MNPDPPVLFNVMSVLQGTLTDPILQTLSLMVHFRVVPSQTDSLVHSDH